MGEEGDFGIPSTQTTMEANATAYLDSFCGYVNSLQVIRYLDYVYFELRIYNCVNLVIKYNILCLFEEQNLGRGDFDERKGSLH